MKALNGMFRLAAAPTPCWKRGFSAPGVAVCPVTVFFADLRTVCFQFSFLL